MLPSSWVSCGPLSWKDFQILTSSYQGSKTFHSIIFNWSKIDLNIIWVSGVQHSDLIFFCIMKWSPWCLVTICHHTKLLQYHWLYFLCHTSHVIYLFYNWKFVPFNLLCLFNLSLHTIPSSNHQFDLCIYEPISVLLCLFLCFFFFSRFHV